MKQQVQNVIIIENNLKLHATYISYFNSYSDFNLCGLFTTVEDALSSYSELAPDMIISEVSFPKMSGIDGISLFRKKDPNVKILMSSMENDVEIIKNSFKNGANGFLSKLVTQKRLYTALVSLKKDGAAISTDVAKKMISLFQRKSYQSFSERENQIIDHLKQGATYKTIAEKLFVTTSAINFHIQNIYLKLNVNSKSEALNKLQEIG
ncbi:response regulator transcription factor [bacterium]|nr:response regulator transcription factor [bacterium]